MIWTKNATVIALQLRNLELEEACISFHSYSFTRTDRELIEIYHNLAVFQVLERTDNINYPVRKTAGVPYMFALFWVESLKS